MTETTTPETEAPEAHGMTAGTEVPTEGHGGGAFPPFDSSTFASQILWFAIAFGLLYYLMSRVALPRLAAILEHRRSRIAADLEAAQRARAESDAAAAAYEASLASARARAQAIAAETRDASNAEAEATRKSLEADLGKRLAEAEATIAKTKAAAMTNVRGIATDAALAIVERLAGKAPERGSVEAAVDAVRRG